MDKKSIIILAVSIAAGLIILGFCIKSGLDSFSAKDRVVTVKGLAEQLIKANSTDINVTSRVSGDDPTELVNLLDAEIEKINKILRKKNYGEIKISNLNFYDSKTYYKSEWDGGKYVQIRVHRYYLSKIITVNINNVEEAESIEQEILLSFIDNGITGDITVNYNFPEVNDFKSELIAESTKNARTAGEQFANDSKSKLGKIKTASQGQITIAGKYYYGEDYDAGSSTLPNPYYQKVRVVSTIEFFLED